MPLKKSASYDNLGWVNALKAQKKARLMEEDAQTDEADLANDALERSAEIAFGKPEAVPGSEEAIRQASRDALAEAEANELTQECDAIRKKLADRDIDPVALGVASSEEWATNDLDALSSLAKKAALAYEKRLKEAWQDKAMAPRNDTFKPDPSTWLGGRIMSSAGANEETRGRGLLPKNANSIFDPFRLDELAKTPTESEFRAKAQKESEEGRKRQKIADIREANKQAPTEMPGRIVPSGGQDDAVMVHKVPRNQLSIMDNLKDKLEDVFASRVEDNKSKTKQFNEERKSEITAKREKDGSWQEPKKASSTSDITKRLMDLWMPEPPPEK